MQDDEDLMPDARSKSSLKREMTALQELGERLTTCPAQLLEKCELPGTLLGALQEFKRLPNKHGARRRQLQYIGKLMRDLDEASLDKIHRQLNRNVEAEKRQFQQLEQWRDLLVAGDETALQQIVEHYPEADLQQVRQLARQARKEQLEDQPPASSRKLFRLLRDMQTGEQ